MASGFFRGTDHTQDARFKNKHEKLLKEMQFPPEYALKVPLLPSHYPSPTSPHPLGNTG